MLNRFHGITSTLVCWTTCVITNVTFSLSVPFEETEWISYSSQVRYLEQRPNHAVTDKQIEKWRTQIRETLSIPHPPLTLAPETHGSFKPCEGVRAERVTFATQFGLRIPAILYLPDPVLMKIPGLIVINGHGGDNYSWYSFY